MMKTTVLIIEAGPAGLAVAGRLRKRNIPFEVVEQTDKIASTWHGHYDRLCLHTVKQLSHLPHLAFPEDYPLYVPRLDLIRYFEQYAEHFDIRPNFKEAIIKLEKKETVWIAKTSKNRSFEAEHIVIATGVNRVPFAPTWEGQAQFKGIIIHSRQYKNPTPYLNKKVLIVGMGNTGAELALDLAEYGVAVSVSVRSPVSIVPRDVNGRPVQLTAKQLAKLPFGLGDWVGTQVRKLVIGDLSKYGLPTSTVPPALQLRATGKTPVIDLGTVRYIKSGDIQILPDIQSFYENGIITKDGKQHEFDVILLATGYRAKVEDFLDRTDELLDQYGVPKHAVAVGWHKGLYFVGFDNYKLGGILGTIYNDSETVAKAIQDRVDAMV